VLKGLVHRCDRSICAPAQDLRKYVNQIPSNELLAGRSGTNGTAELSPVSEVSTRAVSQPNCRDRRPVITAQPHAASGRTAIQ